MTAEQIKNRMGKMSSMLSNVISCLDYSLDHSNKHLAQSTKNELEDIDYELQRVIEDFEALIDYLNPF